MKKWYYDIVKSFSRVLFMIPLVLPNR
jgi:hypothetical protein